jgi:uncharacterized protein (TIGR02453 family)
VPTKGKATSARTDQKADAAPGKFEGFADSKAKFFKDLAKNQDREWFNARKDEYVSGWEQPMRALLHEAQLKLDAAYPDCDLGEPKVFRLNRDVRFSKDKSPYKTNVSGSVHIKLGAGKVTDTPAPLYLQIGTHSLSAAGLYMMDPAQLAKYRAAVLDDKKGAELQSIAKKLTAAGYKISSFEQLKKVPKGVDPDHPRAELLKHKGLIVDFPDIVPTRIAERGFLDDMVKHARAAAPLVRWLTFNVAL